MKGMDTSSAQNSTVFKDMSNIVTKDGSHHEKTVMLKGLKRKSGRTICMEMSHCLGVLLEHILFKAGLLTEYFNICRSLVCLLLAQQLSF